MSRVRVGVGLVAVAAGTAWAVGGIDSVVAPARRLAELLPLLLVLGGALAILLVVVPRGSLAGPVLLVLVGLLGLAAEEGMLRKLYLGRIPGFILVGAGVIVAMSRSKRIKIDTGVKRFTAIFFPAHRHVIGKPPAKVIARAVFGLLKVDMAGADHPSPDPHVYCDVTCILGRVEIIVPKGWKVQAGRVALARHITFEGKVTGTGAAPADEKKGPPRYLAVINVLGWRGFVVVKRS